MELKMSKKITGLFSFDGPMYCDINGVYCNTTITDEMLSRYLSVVDKLIIVMRTFHIDKTFKEAHLEPIFNSKYKFYELPNLNSPKEFIRKQHWKDVLRSEVSDADMFFIRLPSIVSNIIAELCVEENKMYMVEVGGCAWDSYWNHSVIGKICAPYMFYGEKKSIKRATFATYVTEKWLQQRYPCSCPSVNISNVYLPHFEDRILNNRIAHIHNHKNGAPLYIGTSAAVNVRYKGQEYMIQALAKLRKLGIDIRYELIGAGNPDYLKYVARKYKVSEFIEFKGLLLHSEVPAWLDHLDFYIQPSKQEGLPRALIEAMSRGIPSLGSTTAGIPELLTRDVVFDNGDVKKIVEIIKMFMQEDLTIRAKQNYEKAKEFEISALNERRNAFYNEYLNSITKKRNRL